jgi:hypothetical protein
MARNPLDVTRALLAGWAVINTNRLSAPEAETVHMETDLQDLRERGYIVPQLD